MHSDLKCSSYPSDFPPVFPGHFVCERRGGWALYACVRVFQMSNSIPGVFPSNGFSEGFFAITRLERNALVPGIEKRGILFHISCLWEGWLADQVWAQSSTPYKRRISGLGSSKITLLPKTRLTQLEWCSSAGCLSSHWAGLISWTVSPAKQTIIFLCLCFYQASSSQWWFSY